MAGGRSNSSFIKVARLSRDFGAFRAVDNLSFEVARGEVLGFLGSNGAGKSTTMRMLAGFLHPSRGQAVLGGHDITTDRRAAQQLIGYLPEGAPAWPEMTPRGFLLFIARIHGVAAADALARVVALTELQPVLDQPIDTLSKGFRRRVGLAQALIHDPPILIMDEPTDGLDPNQKHHVRRAIREMARDKAIIISTHILEEVEALCSRALIIDHGALVADGTPAELSARSRYHEAVMLTVDSDCAAVVEAAIARGLKKCEIERSVRGAETVYALRDAKLGGRALLAKIDDMARRARGKAQWRVRGLALDQGRLDDVFRTLTKSRSD